MAAENRVFANNFRTNWDISKFEWRIYKFDSNLVKNMSSKNLFPVCLKKFRIATENRFFSFKIEWVIC